MRNRRSIPNKTILALGAVLALTSLATESWSLEKVRVGTIGSVSDAGIYVGIAKGYFQEQGLDVEPMMFNSGSNQMGVLSAGQIDVAGGSPAAGMFNAFSQGINVRIVADKGSHTPGHGYIGYLMRKELASEVKKVEDLKKLPKIRFALPSTGGIGSEAQYKTLVKRAGLDEKRIEIKIVPYSQVPSALASNGLDIGPVLEPFVTKAVEQGLGVNLLWMDELRPNDIGGVLMYSEKFTKERQDAAKKFMVGYVKAVRYYLDAFASKDAPNRKEVIDILTKNTTVKDPAIYERIRLPGFAPDVRVNMDSLKDLYAEFVAMGYIQNPEKVKVEDVVDNSYIDYAIQTLGKANK